MRQKCLAVKPGGHLMAGRNYKYRVEILHKGIWCRVGTSKTAEDAEKCGMQAVRAMRAYCVSEYRVVVSD